MVPPAKPAASPIRTSRTAAPAPSPRARPFAAFEALLLPRAAARANVTVRSPEPRPGDSPEQASKTASKKDALVDDEKPRASKAPKPAESESLALDPSTRLSAQLAPPIALAPANAAEPASARTRVSLEELIPQVLRRIAWGGDRTKGSVLLELATGEKVTVHAAGSGRRVRVEVEGNDDLERRIGSRLRAAGIEVEGVR